MTENEKYLEMPWSIEDTIENLTILKENFARILSKLNFEGLGESDVKEAEFDFDRAIQALKKVQVFEAIGTIEEFKALKETNVEIEIPEPQGNEIVAGIMIPKVKGKAVVSLSDLHDILMDVGGTNIRDKVFEQIYNRDIIIGLRDVIEKWEERRKYESNRNR